MSGEALIWLLAGMGIGIALSMLILAGVAMSDRRQIRRAAVIAEESAPIAEIAAASVKPARLAGSLPLTAWAAVPVFGLLGLLDVDGRHPADLAAGTAVVVEDVPPEEE